MAIEIRRTPIGGKLDDFLEVVEPIYRGDPHFVRSLNMDLKDRLSPKNPFFQHASGIVLTAYDRGRCVGRCTAQIDREHLGLHKDDAGFFGFLDTIEDPDVTRALLDTAGSWLADRGMKTMRGPLSLCTNEEVGCLVDGFDTPPMVLMPHHRTYQGKTIEAAGLTKLKDFYAWRYKVGSLPERARRGRQEISSLPEVRTRTVDKSRLPEEVRVIMGIFNDAWSENWGFVPLTEAELKKLAEDFKLLIVPELTVIAEIDRKPAAFGIAIPNLNELIRDMHGKLSPAGIAKLIWRLKVKGPKTARLALLGIRKEYRSVRKYAGLSAFLYAELNDAAARLGIEWGELSWTFEDNVRVNAGIRMMGGEVYKTYRVYEKAL